MDRVGALVVGVGLFVLLVVWRAGFFGPPPFEDWLFLVPAWILGLGLAYALWRPSTPTRRVTQQWSPTPGTHSDDLSGAIDPVGHELEIVEGIGAGYGRRLRALGIADTRALVAKGARAANRNELAEHLKIEPLVVQRWSSMADLLRIPGMDAQSAEVIEASGVQTVASLAQRSAAALVGELFEVNARLRLTPDALPAVHQVENWIGLATLLPTVIEDL